MDINLFLSKFSGVKKKSKGWMAKCPCHDDIKASLSISQGSKQPIVLKCFAGCQTKNILNAIGLTESDICDDNWQYTKNIDNYPPCNPKSGQTPKKLITTYDYVNEEGILLYQVCRFEPKTFKQRRPEQNGKWSWNLKGVEPILYNLPAIIKEKCDVLICEGEKDVDNLNKLGFTATTCSGGAGKWNKEFNQYLQGKNIVLIPDNDEPGRKHMQTVAEFLKGTAADVKMLCLPGLPEKGDVSDYIAGFKGKNLQQDLTTLIDQAEDPFKKIEVYIDRTRVKEILDIQEPCKPFDITKLPPLLYHYVDTLCSQTDAEPIMVVQSTLCTIAAMIGRKVFIPEFFGQNLYANIWCCTISKSGSFKTTALKLGAEIATKKRLELFKKIKEVKASDKTQKKIDKEIYMLESQNPIFSEKSTAEAFLDELSTGQAGQIITSEMGAWLKNLNQKSTGTMKELLTEFYDCGGHYTARTRTKGKVEISRPFITINGVSTLEWIQKNLQEDDLASGFFARFLFFYPPQDVDKIPPALPSFNQIFQKERQKYADLIVKKLNSAGGMYCIRDVTEKAFTQYHESLYQTLFKEDGKIRKVLEPFLKRWSPTMLKLMMLMQSLKEENSKEKNSILKTLDIESFYTARYILDYAIKSTTYLFKNELGESPHQKKCRIVLQYLAKHGGKRTWWQLLGSHLLEGGKLDYEYPCQTLEESGEIVVDRTSSSKKYHVYCISENKV